MMQLMQQTLGGRFLRVGVIAMAAFAVMTFLVWGGYVEAEQAQHGVLTKARGEVTIQKAGTVAWVTAHERQRVSQGDRIRTGRNGEAVVRISERNFVAIKENAEITINTSRVRTEQDPNNRVLGLFPARVAVQDVEIGLDRGRSVSVMRGLRGNSGYRVRTPVATVGVRGTTCMADVIPAPGGSSANLGCLDGLAAVTPNTPGAFTPVNLGPGDFFSVGFSPAGLLIGPPPSVIPAPSPELINMASTFVDIRSNASDFTSGGDAPTLSNAIEQLQVLVSQQEHCGY
jgi:hypothetical protein